MLKRSSWNVGGGALLAAACSLACPTCRAARAADPITIGFGMALTGGLAPNGKAALLAMQIWEEEINAKGGLLGPAGQAGLLRRPVQPIHGARASTPSCWTSTKSIS